MSQPDYLEIVDALTAQGLPWTSMNNNQILANVRSAVPSRQRARVFVELQANPSLAISGNPRISRSLQRLLSTASTQGYPVVLPACEMCQRQVFLVQTLPNGKRVCQACEYSLNVAPCATCGKVSVVCARPEGLPICLPCYRRAGYLSEDCIVCGKLRVVNKRTSEGPICYNCSPSKRVCIDCGKSKRVAKLHTAGPLCHSCHSRRRSITQLCPQCQESRLVAYSASSGTITCADCANATPIYSCTDCGTEQNMYGARCASCERKTRLDRLFTGPDGGTPEDMVQVKSILLQASDPAKIARWVNRSSTASILKDIVNGKIPPTYAALADYPVAAATSVRALLEQAEVLDPTTAPSVDFEQWLGTHLANVPSPRCDIIRRFALWGIFRRIETTNAKSDYSNIQFQLIRARLRVRIVTRFLDFLEEHDTDIHHADHSLYDQYTTTHPETLVDLTSFIRWLRDSRIPTRISLSKLSMAHPTAMLDYEIYQSTIKRLITPDSTGTIRERLVGLLVGLYGIPLTRIVTLKAENIITDEADVRIRLAADEITMPRAMGDLARQQIVTSQIQLKGTSSTWLFPSLNSGRHVHPRTLSAGMKNLGIKTVELRGAAILNLVQTLPLAVVRDFTGIGHSALHRWREVARRDWQDYPALRMT